MAGAHLENGFGGDGGAGARKQRGGVCAPPQGRMLESRRTRARHGRMNRGRVWQPTTAEPSKGSGCGRDFGGPLESPGQNFGALLQPGVGSEPRWRANTERQPPKTGSGLDSRSRWRCSKVHKTGGSINIFILFICINHYEDKTTLSHAIL
jgi:hypothetical protein